MKRHPSSGLTGGLGLAILGAALLIITVEGIHELSIQRVVRVTARCSAVLFLTVFATPGLVRLTPRWLGGWLTQQSPAIFLSFAVSHLVHLTALIIWAALFPSSFFADFHVVPVLFGACLYGVIMVIALRALRSWPIGQLRLTRFETLGMYFLWAAFALAFVARAWGSVIYLLFAIAALAALGLRLGANVLASARVRHVA